MFLKQQQQQLQRILADLEQAKETHDMSALKQLALELDQMDQDQLKFQTHSQQRLAKSGSTGKLPASNFQPFLASPSSSLTNQRPQSVPLELAEVLQQKEKELQFMKRQLQQLQATAAPLSSSSDIQQQKRLNAALSLQGYDHFGRKRVAAAQPSIGMVKSQSNPQLGRQQKSAPDAAYAQETMKNMDSMLKQLMDMQKQLNVLEAPVQGAMMNASRPPVQPMARSVRPQAAVTPDDADKMRKFMQIQQLMEQLGGKPPVMRQPVAPPPPEESEEENDAQFQLLLTLQRQLEQLEQTQHSKQKELDKKQRELEQLKEEEERRLEMERRLVKEPSSDRDQGELSDMLTTVDANISKLVDHLVQIDHLKTASPSSAAELVELESEIQDQLKELIGYQDKLKILQQIEMVPEPTPAASSATQLPELTDMEKLVQMLAELQSRDRNPVSESEDKKEAAVEKYEEFRKSAAYSNRDEGEVVFDQGSPFLDEYGRVAELFQDEPLVLLNILKLLQRFQSKRSRHLLLRRILTLAYEENVVDDEELEEIVGTAFDVMEEEPAEEPSVNMTKKSVDARLPISEETNEPVESSSTAPERFTSFQLLELKNKVTGLVKPFVSDPKKEQEFIKEVDDLLMSYIGTEVASNRLNLLIKLNRLFESFVDQSNSADTVDRWPSVTEEEKTLATEESVALPQDSPEKQSPVKSEAEIPEETLDSRDMEAMRELSERLFTQLMKDQLNHEPKIYEIME